MLYFILIFLLIIFILIIYFYFKKKFFQVSNIQDPLKYPIIYQILNNNIWNTFNFDNKFNFINSNKNFFSCNKNSIKIFKKGYYKINFNISGYADLVLENQIQEDNLYINDENNSILTDFTLEWKLTQKQENEEKDIFILPAFSINRTNGPENINSITKIICINEPCTTINFYYRNPDTRPILNYKINNFNCIIEKL